MLALASRLVVFLCFLSIFAESYAAGQTSLMQSAEDLRGGYETRLDHLQADLAMWERALQNIDPGREGVSYKEGKLIERNQKLGLLQISNLRTMIRREREHRSVSGELSLGLFLAELSTDFYTLSVQGAFNNLSVESVGRYGAEVGAMQKSFTEEGMNRVKAMEASGCVASKE
jgi:hypothetical protein